MFELENEVSKYKIRVYGCGGGGINILSEYIKIRPGPLIGFAAIDPCYIDTSDSNLKDKEGLKEEDVFSFDGVDGSGKVRSMNYEDINKNSKSILLKHKPHLFNVVIHTASGGSGSVIGPVLVSELKSRGLHVIVLLIGSTDTRIEIENTIKTLKSYESIAEKRNSPVVIEYTENTIEANRDKVNSSIKMTLTMLTGLYSGQISEIDSADLTNWLEYTKFTKTKPRLSSLVIVKELKGFANTSSIVSVATIALAEHNTRLDKTPAYQCVGYAPNVWKCEVPNSLNIIDKHPIHFTISDDFILGSVNKLVKSLQEIDDIYNSRNERDSIVNEDDGKTDSGLVL